MGPTSPVTEAAVSDADGKIDLLSWWLKMLGLLVAGFCWDGMRGTREGRGRGNGKGARRAEMVGCLGFQAGVGGLFA